jgi:F-type H+-transporting ATPase subunit a
MLILAASDKFDPLGHVLPHTVFNLGGFAVTNHLIMTMVAAVVVALVFWSVSRKVQTTGHTVDDHLTKGAFAQLFETICVFIREKVARPNLGHLTDKYIYFLWTIFFFILFANVLGMVPIGYFAKLIAYAVGASPEPWSHLGGTATSNLSLNVPLALTALVAIVFIGIRENGKGFFAHFAPGPPVMWPMLIPLEVLGLLIKCTVLAMRLFGTMLAGHLVLTALVGMIFIFASLSPLLGYGVGIGVVFLNLALSLLELFIAMLQAFIFTFLTTLFIAQGAVHHGDDHDHDHAHEAHVGPGQRSPETMPDNPVPPPHPQPVA